MKYVHTIRNREDVHLSDLDPNECQNLSKEEALSITSQLGEELDELEDLLYESSVNGLLVVLQGLDTSGKDGTIRHLLKYVNAQSCRVVSFKQPTPQELSHDFLWRIHLQCPSKGEMVIFNRSHYEDVLVVRVHNLVPKEIWGKRYATINHFEENLVDSGIIILKFMLHISYDEQEKRLLERENLDKAWKLSVNDWKERLLWKEYQHAYEVAVSKCSSEYAPWHIVPANKKWFRNLAITHTIVESLRSYREDWLHKLHEIGQRNLEELKAYRDGLSSQSTTPEL